MCPKSARRALCACSGESIALTSSMMRAKFHRQGRWKSNGLVQRRLRSKNCWTWWIVYKPSRAYRRGWNPCSAGKGNRRKKSFRGCGSNIISRRTHDLPRHHSTASRSGHRGSISLETRQRTSSRRTVVCGDRRGHSYLRWSAAPSAARKLLGSVALLLERAGVRRHNAEVGGKGVGALQRSGALFETRTVIPEIIVTGGIALDSLPTAGAFPAGDAMAELHHASSNTPGTRGGTRKRSQGCTRADAGLRHTPRGHHDGVCSGYAEQSEGRLCYPRPLPCSPLSARDPGRLEMVQRHKVPQGRPDLP
jgi:hypothetical protein